MQELKNRLLSITSEYASKSLESSNLLRSEKRGLQSLQQKVREGEVVVFETDKSSRFSVDTIDNYKDICNVHMKDDEIVSLNEYDRVEKRHSAHAIMWARMLRAGVDTGQEERVKNNMISKSSPVAPFYGPRKDHKPVTPENAQKGPPVRPLCGASDSHNHKLSHILSRILKPVWMNKDNTTSCMSTEEMAAEIERVNCLEVHDTFIVGSADVKALYPSLDISFTIDIVCEEFRNSIVTIKGIDYTEVGLYLALHLDVQQLRRLCIQNVCPTRKHKKGKPTITSSGIASDRATRFKPWKKRLRAPNPQQKRVMLIEALRIALNFTMRNHMYTFDNVIRRQKGGGPIGLDLTGNMAQIFMKWYDGQLINKLTVIGLPPRMYKRYVDDINTSLFETPLGATYKDGKLEIDVDKITSDNYIAADVRAMRILRDVGNDIHFSIELETDCPSNHDNGKMPILDMLIWVSEDNTILHEFYMKGVSSRYTVHARSAMAIGTKRQILTQDALRILLNCSKTLPWEEKAHHLEEYVARLQYSGYDQKFRYEIINSAVMAYHKIQANDSSGIRPMYRPREWKWKEREMEKRDKRLMWFRKGGFQSVLFIPATPGSELMKRFRDEINKSRFKVRLIELSGRSVKSMLQRSNPFEKNTCAREGCAVCSTGGRGPCHRMGITYEIRCGCADQYDGQTARNAYERGKEHFDALSNKKGPLWNHCVEKHESDSEQTFIMNITGQYRRDSMLRQLGEAVRINRDKPVMNSKDEYNVMRIPRARVTYDDGLPHE